MVLESKGSQERKIKRRLHTHVKAYAYVPLKHTWAKDLSTYTSSSSTNARAAACEEYRGRRVHLPSEHIIRLYPTNHVATSWQQVVPLPQHPQPPRVRRRVLQRGRRDAYIPPDSTAERGISRIDQAKVPTRANIRRYKSTHGGVYPMPEKARNVLGGQPRSCGGSSRPSDAC